MEHLKAAIYSTAPVPHLKAAIYSMAPVQLLRLYGAAQSCGTGAILNTIKALWSSSKLTLLKARAAIVAQS
jgi:hypothetical protein